MSHETGLIATIALALAFALAGGFIATRLGPPPQSRERSDRLGKGWTPGPPDTPQDETLAQGDGAPEGLAAPGTLPAGGAGRGGR